LGVARIRNGYPAEKPVAMSETLIKQSSDVGELVIDPFMGSASVGLAALKLKRGFMGNDLCDEAVRISKARLSNYISPNGNGSQIID
jgi:site-specific DNA-methyltransferase (adenine-specific)